MELNEKGVIRETIKSLWEEIDVLDIMILKNLDVDNFYGLDRRRYIKQKEIEELEKLLLIRDLL